MYLNCHSYYSLRYGTLSPADLVSEAVLQGIDTLALTDINNSTGMVDFVAACRKLGVHSIGGVEFRSKEHILLYTVIAKNNTGYKEINDFLTWHNLNKTPLPPCPPVFKNAFTLYPFTNKLPRKLKEHEYIGIKPQELNKLISWPSKQWKNKLLAFYPVTLGKGTDYKLHQYLRAIDRNTLLTMLSPADLALPGEKFVSPDLFRIAYEDHSYILKNTEKVLKQCHIDFDFTHPKNKKVFSGSPYDDKLLLEKLAYDGMLYRYGENNASTLR